MIVLAGPIQFSSSFAVKILLHWSETSWPHSSNNQGRLLLLWKENLLYVMEVATAYWRENSKVSLCYNILEWALIPLLAVKKNINKKGMLCKGDLRCRQWVEYMLSWSGIQPIKTVRHFLTVIRLSGFILSQTSSPKESTECKLDLVRVHTFYCWNLLGIWEILMLQPKSIRSIKIMKTF